MSGFRHYNVYMTRRTHHPDDRVTIAPSGARRGKMPAKKIVLANPVDLAAQVMAGEIKIEDTPTFAHEVRGVTFEAHVVKADAGSDRVNPVAIIEDGAYVKDNTYVGNDRTSKDGFYRIDKATDQQQQAEWRAKRAALLEAAANASEEEDEDDEVEAPAPRRRTRKAS